MRIAGLFAGIGGIERGFEQVLGSAAKTDFLCESWAPARAVLGRHFPDVEIHPDVRELRDLPPGLDLVAAGFPCTDLSQAGRMAGIEGAQSSLVSHVFESLRRLRRSGEQLPWLMIENVPNMLALDKGRAMAYLVDEVEALGYRWAYRVVDSRFTGVPQRRRRVIFLASATDDPRQVLFADETEGLDDGALRSDAFGFYWTEGRGGLGWATDAVPTLKGGSTIGIPSPPAVWVPSAALERRFVTPGIEDAEAMQGFLRGWTDLSEDLAPGMTSRRIIGTRWKLVGNAVTARVSAWVASRLTEPGDVVDVPRHEWSPKNAWPKAAWSDAGKVWAASVSEFPRRSTYEHLAEVVDLERATPLSDRAINGFLHRLRQGNLGRHPGFREDVEQVAALSRLPVV